MTQALTVDRRLLQRMIDGIGYVARHGMIVEAVPVPGTGAEAAGQARVRLPATADNANLVGGLHAAALFCLAETAAGIAAWCIESDPATMVWVRSVEVQYPARAAGDVVAVANVTTLVGNDATVAVSATDEAGRTVMTARFSYALRRAASDGAR